MPKKDKKKRDKKTSRGLKQSSRTKRIISRLMMKINRWNRYKEEINAHKRSGNVGRWDISRIEKHIKLLKKLVKS